MPSLPSDPRPDCPVCGDPCKAGVKRPARWLATCGKGACGYELRARSTRGREYGNTGGGPGRTETAGYSAIHGRARRILRGRPCERADDGTCSGRIEAALRADFPRPLLVVNEQNGALYYPGLNTEDAYHALCRSHHAREGGLVAAAARSQRVAGAAVADRVRAEHGACSPLCGVCGLIGTLDDILGHLVDFETRVMTERARAS